MLFENVIDSQAPHIENFHFINEKILCSPRLKVYLQSQRILEVTLELLNLVVCYYVLKIVLNISP